MSYGGWLPLPQDRQRPPVLEQAFIFHAGESSDQQIESSFILVMK